ncbi:MAG TPA: SDR family NAD(P)-dependent oxidoreductase [Casimicrobiaceae bacterium]|jgi:NAD(P)-dependent dehydrogenase (short-subunit alcohol dehydrogenase family)
MHAAIITGVSRGLGEAIAARLLALQWTVVGVGRKSAARLRGERYRFVKADLADVDAVEGTLAEPLTEIAHARPATIVCVNNAAVAGPLGIGGRLPQDQIAASFALNLAAPAAIANLFCRVFTDAASDRRIINISSGAAQTPLPGIALYCAAKAGLEMLTRTLAAEQGPNGICVISLRPGIIDTDMQSLMRSHSDDVLPAAAMFRGFHAQRQLVAPDVAAAKIVEKILLAPVEQGGTYKYLEL